MRMDSSDLLILQHDLTAAVRRQEATVRELDERIKHAPKRLKRAEADRYDGCAMMIDAFKKGAGIARLAGQKDLTSFFVESRVRLKRDREELRRRIAAVQHMDITSLLRKGMRPNEFDIEPRIADLVIFAASKRAFRHPLPPGVEKTAFRLISDSDLRSRKIEQGLKSDRLLLDTAARMLTDLQKGFDLLVHTLQAVRRREALTAQEEELIGVRKTKAEVVAAMEPAIEKRKVELAGLTRKLEDERWAELDAQESLRRFFAGHPGLVKPMVSVLKNLPVLCGPVLKCEISEITSFEIGVAEKESATTLESLDSADPLRCISEEERRAVFAALRSDEALDSYNMARRAMRSQKEVEAAITAARQELAGLELGVSEEAERKAADARAASSELSKDLKKARHEARVRLEELRGYYVSLRKKYGARGGFAGFPAGHRAFMEGLTDSSRLRWRTARKLFDEYEKNMHGNVKAAREAWDSLEFLRLEGRTRPSRGWRPSTSS
jgi:hypothetical protein